MKLTAEDMLLVLAEVTGYGPKTLRENDGVGNRGVVGQTRAMCYEIMRLNGIRIRDIGNVFNRSEETINSCMVYLRRQMRIRPELMRRFDAINAKYDEAVGSDTGAMVAVVDRRMTELRLEIRDLLTRAQEVERLALSLIEGRNAK